MGLVRLERLGAGEKAGEGDRPGQPYLLHPAAWNCLEVRASVSLSLCEFPSHLSIL